MILQPTMGRRALAQLFASRGYVRGAEIGVAAGHYAAWLLDANPHLTLFCVDAWHAYPGYLDFPQHTLDAFEQEAVFTLARYGPRAQILKRCSLDAAMDLADGSLDFVYLDAAHSRTAVTADLQAWVPKVRSGGIVSGHDYCRKPGLAFGVIDAVDTYADTYHLPLVILQGPDKRPSWAWEVP